jgi:hypothetical protein
MTEWKPGMGRAGYVPPWVKGLPLRVKSRWCRWRGHPVESLEMFTWLVDGKMVPGHLCLRCFSRAYPDKQTISSHPRLRPPL